MSVRHTPTRTLSILARSSCQLWFGDAWISAFTLRLLQDPSLRMQMCVVIYLTDFTGPSNRWIFCHYVDIMYSRLSLIYLFINAELHKTAFGMKLKSEFAMIPASGQLQTIHSSVLYARGSEQQHYATSCCVTLLYVCNVIFSPQRDTSHGVKLVSKWPWFPPW